MTRRSTSLANLNEDTGVTTLDVARRTTDFGVGQYFTSHEPWVIGEPMTPEPSETYSRADLDTYAAILEEVVNEAYEEPQTVISSPHRRSVHRIDHEPLDDPDRWAMTWRGHHQKSER